MQTLLFKVFYDKIHDVRSINAAVQRTKKYILCLIYGNNCNIYDFKTYYLHKIYDFNVLKVQ